MTEVVGLEEVEGLQDVVALCSRVQRRLPPAAHHAEDGYVQWTWEGVVNLRLGKLVGNYSRFHPVRLSMWE